MDKRKIALGLVAGALALAFVSCAKTEDKQDVATGASDAGYDNTAIGEVAIDWRYNMAAEDVENNYFTWTADGWSVEDNFDAATGASAKGSTKAFNKVYKPAEKMALPKVFRYLMLYPISPRAVAEMDNLQIVENGKQLEISFIHRGNAMKIVTDEEGLLDLESSFFELGGVADMVEGGTFTLKPEYVLDGGDPASMASADWEKIALMPSVADDDAPFKGKLGTAYADGVLCITGTLSKN